MEAFKILLNDSERESDIQSVYPFAKCSNFNGQNYEEHFEWICSVFAVAKMLSSRTLAEQ